MRRAFCALGCALLLGACAHVPAVSSPPQGEVPPLEGPPAPTVVSHFGGLHTDVFAEVRDSSGGLPLASMTRRYDTERFTRQRTRWGQPGLEVLVFMDTDRKGVSDAPLTAWFLADESFGLESKRPVSRASRLVPLPPPPGPRPFGPKLAGSSKASSEEGEQVVGVLLRGFDGQPHNEDLHLLLLSFRDLFPPPWTLCHPLAEGREDQRIAYDSRRGLKLGLQELAGGGGWRLDHLEFLPRRSSWDAWWEAKGYEGCAVEGVLQENGLFKPARPRPGPQAGTDPGVLSAVTAGGPVVVP